MGVITYGGAAMAELDEPFLYEVTVARPAAEVWTAITEKTQVDTYYFAPLAGDLTHEGQEFFYGSEEGQAIVGRILRFEPPGVLEHSFRFAEPGAPESTATYLLREADGQTVVRIEHRGYAPGSQPYADIAMGWPIILSGLKAHLESQ